MEVGDASEEDGFVNQQTNQAHPFEDEKPPASSTTAAISPSDERVEGEGDQDRQLNRDTRCQPQVQVRMVVEDHGADEGGDQPEPTHKEKGREASAMVAEELLSLAERWATSLQKSVQGPERLAEVAGNSDLKEVAPE